MGHGSNHRWPHATHSRNDQVPGALQDRSRSWLYRTRPEAPHRGHAAASTTRTPPLSTTGEFTTLVSEGPLILLRPSPLPGIPPDAKKISCMRRRLARLGSTSPSNRRGAYRCGMAGPRVGMVASKMVFFDRPNVLNSTGVCIGPDGSAMDRGWNSVDEGQFDQALDVFGPSAGAALYRRDVLESVGLLDEDFLAYYEDLDLAWRTRLAGWEARFAPRAIVHHKYSASYGSGNPMKTYLCERNRVWNLVQNYPWRYVTTGIPWNLVRVMAGPLPWNGSKLEPGQPTRGRFGKTAAAMARGRLDAYAGLARALSTRPGRGATSRADGPTAGGRG